MSQTTVLELETTSASPPRVHASASATAWHLGLLALSIFLSAFLLFQVQPLISRWILPWFGGSTAVWTTCMLFFQVTLFAGYAYAHLTSRWLGPQRQGTLHVLLLLAACALLPIMPDESWKPADSFRPTGLILGLLAATVGLPYFVLSSTGPLLQSWFARGFPGRSPYRLYALSNVGSLLALLSYPFVVEPLLPLPAQAWGWSIGFAVLTGTIGYCAWKQIRSGSAIADQSPGGIPPAAARTGPRHEAPSLTARTAWLVLPALASVMLLATTNHVCQNIAVIPLLWIAPLSLYLLTFIISFDHPRWYRRGWLALGTLAAAFLSAGASDIDFVYGLSIVPELGLYLLTMFGACLLCHGELARLRPRTEWLTEFYLLMSAGGALGGVLVSLVAPVVFSSFYEWRLSVVGTLALALGVLLHELAAGAWKIGTASERWWPRAAMLGGVGGGGLVLVLVAASWQLPPSESLAQVRNFYGVITLDDADPDDPAEHHRTFRSGRIVHGRQYCDPAKRWIPLTYYHEDSGVGLVLKECGTRGPLRVAVVGLGTGTLATYARPGDHYRFYEINPAVTRAAHEWFTFLADCRGTVEVVDGDARLVLEREEVEPYDVIVLDAFSGDSVPVHLLTREAFAIYRRRLRADGMIAVNVLNHHLQLSSEVEGQADALGLGHTRIVRPREASRLRFGTDWILISGDAERLRALPSEVPQHPLDLESKNRNIPLWTDHYSNLIDLLTDR